MGGRYHYLAYDNISFQNPAFAQYSEGKQVLGGAKPYQIDSLVSAEMNRFNIDLLKETCDRNQVDPRRDTNHNYHVGVSASGGQQPAPLLGATLRSLDQAGKAVGRGLFGAEEEQ